MAASLGAVKKWGSNALVNGRQAAI